MSFIRDYFSNPLSHDPLVVGVRDIELPIRHDRGRFRYATSGSLIENFYYVSAVNRGQANRQDRLIAAFPGSGFAIAWLGVVEWSEPRDDTHGSRGWPSAGQVLRRSDWQPFVLSCGAECWGGLSISKRNEIASSTSGRSSEMRGPFCTYESGDFEALFSIAQGIRRVIRSAYDLHMSQRFRRAAGDRVLWLTHPTMRWRSAYSPRSSGRF